MSGLSPEILKLRPPEKSLTVIMTVGNDLRGDDGAGPDIFSRLKSGPYLQIFSARTNPENFLDEICRLAPARIYIIDAADFGGTPGEVRIIENDLIPETSVSTHLISLKIISKILETDARVPVVFIGIQPASLEFHEGLSPPVKISAEQLAAEINGWL